MYDFSIAVHAYRVVEPVNLHAFNKRVIVSDMVRNVIDPLSLSDCNLLKQLKPLLAFRSQPFLMGFLNFVSKVLIHHFISNPLFF